MSPAFILVVAALFVWGSLARLWLPNKGVELLRTRWVGVPHAKRVWERQLFALTWAVGQTIIVNAMMFSLDLASALRNGQPKAFAVWAFFSGVAFVLGYLWFLGATHRAIRPQQPA